MQTLLGIRCYLSEWVFLTARESLAVELGTGFGRAPPRLWLWSVALSVTIASVARGSYQPKIGVSDFLWYISVGH